MVSNPVLVEQAALEMGKTKKTRTDFIEDFNSRQYNSFSAQINPDQKLVNISISESQKSEDEIKQMQDPHFVEQRYQYKLLKERNNRY